MNGRKNFHTNLKNQPNEPVGERVVSERGRKELPPGTKGGENLKPNRYYEHKQHAFDSYCKKVLHLWENCPRQMWPSLQFTIVTHGSIRLFLWEMLLC